MLRVIILFFILVFFLLKLIYIIDVEYRNLFKVLGKDILIFSICKCYEVWCCCFFYEIWKKKCC